MPPVYFTRPRIQRYLMYRIGEFSTIGHGITRKLLRTERVFPATEMFSSKDENAYLNSIGPWNLVLVGTHYWAYNGIDDSDLGQIPARAFTSDCTVVLRKDTIEEIEAYLHETLFSS